MKRSIGVWQLFGFAVTSLGGTLLHFLYEWLGESAWIAPFSGVNESTWEHMKLFFIPAFIFAFIQSAFLSKRYDNFWVIKAIGALLGVILIPVLFYTYNGAFGKSPDWLNILFFILATALAYFFEFLLFLRVTSFSKLSPCAFILLCAIAFFFVFFTFFPPKLPIFQDPTTKLYGINYSLE